MRFFFSLLLFFSLSQVQLLAQVSGCNVNYINPLDGSKINSVSTTTLVWQNIPGAASYDLWVGTGNVYGLKGTLTPGINGTTSFTLTNLLGSTTYKWYPVAKNADGSYVQSCFPTSASFTTADSPAPPACTYYFEPQNGATLITQTTAQLTWASAPSATAYDIYLWTGDVAPTQPIATAASSAYFYNATGLLAGTTYHWYVTPRNTAGPATNCIYTQVNFNTAPAIPGNDDCTGALEVIPGTIVNSCGPTLVTTTIGATASPVPGCTGSAEDDIWFKFTPTSKRNKVSLAVFAVINPVIELFSGNCSSLTSIGCYTTTLAPYPTVQNLLIELPVLVPGQTYYYRVYGSGSNSERTKVNTCITSIPDAPSNDECTGALLLTANADTSTTYSYTGATGYASQSMISCVDPNYTAPDVWFKFVATASSQKISVIPGNIYDYAFQVFEGSCGNLAPLACINNGGYSQPDTTVVNNLIAGNTYYMRVWDYHGTGAPSAQFKIVINTAQMPSPASANGLQAVYYNGTALSGAPLLTRIDSSINFELTYSKQPVVLSPAPGIVPEDGYSVRWTGKVKAQFSEPYTFYTVADDGIRLRVNGQLLVDNWVNQGATEKSGTIALTAGQQYDIVIEYYENTGEAVTKLLWSSPSTPKAIVPKSQLYASTVTTAPSCTLNNLPANGSVTADAASALLSWASIPEADGYKIFVWQGSSVPGTALATVTNNSYTVTGLLPSTVYRWYIVPFNAAGDATGCSSNSSSFTTAAAAQPPAGNGTGLQGVYFNGTSLSGTPLLTRTDPTINFELSYSKQPVVLSPAPGIVPEDLYSVRWTGQVQPLYSETYTFYTVADDGVRLWVNGQLLVDNWANQGPTEKSGSIALLAGQQYDIVVEYYESTGEAVTKLLWSSPSTPKQIIPKTALYPSNVVPSMVPKCTVNTAPSDGSTINPAIPGNLSWNPVANATEYEVYLWTGTTATPKHVATTLVNGMGLGYLAGSSVYNWYIVPRNVFGSATGCAVNKTSFTTTVLIPVNDDCTGAINVIPSPNAHDCSGFSKDFNNVGATSSMPGCVGAAEDDVWFKFTAISTTHHVVLFTGPVLDVALEVFAGNCQSLTPLLCTTANTTISNLVPGQTYYCRLYGIAANNPPFSMTVCITTPVQEAPGCTANILPEDGTVIASPTSAQLKWQSVKTAFNYNLYIWSGSTPPVTPTLELSGDSSRIVNGLLPSTTYKWYVVPKNELGTATGCASSQTSFTTAPATPPPGNGSGLQGVYFDGTGLSGTPSLTRIDSTINFTLSYSNQPVVLSPAPGIVPEDLYSVRWNGQVQPRYSETYTFYTVADDGIRLWVNGQLLVDNWTNQGATEKSGSIALLAGQKYDIVIEYYESGGEAVTKLLWSSASTLKQIVPSTQLYPPAAGARIMSSNLPVITANTVLASPAVSAHLSPNPVRPGNLAKLQISSNKAATGIISVSSSNGRMVSTEKIKLVTGINTATINTRGLAQGLYIITVTGGSKPINLKLLVE